MRHPATSLAALCAGALLLSGCGSAWPATEAEEGFIEHFTQAYPDAVVDTLTESAAKWPFSPGELSAMVVLADDTPPETFEQILEEVLTWDTGNSTNYAGRGAIANGLGVCAGDEQRELKAQLRADLHAQGLALAGNWPCTVWERPEGADYQASVADFSVDTEAVRDLLAGSDLWVRADLHDPWGSVEAPWAQVPSNLEDTLAAVAGVMQISSFEFTPEHGLRIAVPATSNLPAAQQAAEEAAGPELAVEVVQGNLDPAKAEEIGPLAPVADAVREVPGVAAVTAHPGQIVITVEGGDAGTGAVIEAVETARTHADLGTASIEIRVPAATDGIGPQHRYYWRPGATTDALPAFVDLMGQDVVELVRMTESRRDAESPEDGPAGEEPSEDAPAGEAGARGDDDPGEAGARGDDDPGEAGARGDDDPGEAGARGDDDPGEASARGDAVHVVSLSVDLAAPIVEGLPQVKSVVPDGAAVTVKGNDGLATVDFVAAPTLSAEDLTTRFTTPDLEAIATAWNTAP